MLAAESVMNPLLIRVYVVNNHVGIAGMTGSEDDYLEMTAEVFEYLSCVGSDIDAGFYEFSSGKLYGQFNIVRLISAVVTMNQGLIQIKDNRLLIYIHHLLP